MLQFMGSQRVGHDWATELNWTELNRRTHFIIKQLYEGNFFLFFIILHFTCKKTEMKGVRLLTHPLQCSCLENPRAREAWWAAVYVVAQSRTRLKRLSSSSISKLIASAVRYSEKEERRLITSIVQKALGWRWEATNIYKPRINLRASWGSWSSRILAIWREWKTHCKSPWFWERLRAEGEEGIRGWDHWWNGHERSQRVGYNWAIEQQQQ